MHKFQIKTFKRKENWTQNPYEKNFKKDKIVELEGKGIYKTTKIGENKEQNYFFLEFEEVAGQELAKIKEVRQISCFLKSLKDKGIIVKAIYPLFILEEEEFYSEIKKFFKIKNSNKLTWEECEYLVVEVINNKKYENYIVYDLFDIEKIIEKGELITKKNI